MLTFVMDQAMWIGMDPFYRGCASAEWPKPETTMNSCVGKQEIDGTVGAGLLACVSSDSP